MIETRDGRTFHVRSGEVYAIFPGREEVLYADPKGNITHIPMREIAEIAFYGANT